MNKIVLLALSSMILASSSVYAADQTTGEPAGATAAPTAPHHKPMHHKTMHHHKGAHHKVKHHYKGAHHKVKHHKHPSHKKAESTAPQG